MAIAGIFTLYWTALILYRLFFHPLARFPCPKFDACSFLYERYYDLVKAPGGQYFRHVADLHPWYGPVVRITPDEVQLHDISWYGTIFLEQQPEEERNTHP